MSTWRYDTSERTKPKGLRKSRSHDEGTHDALENRAIGHDGAQEEQSVLSVVVPAKNEAPSLPQLVRFFRVNQMKLKPGALFIFGAGSAAADGGKNTFTAPSPLSSFLNRSNKRKCLGVRKAL